MQQQSNKVIEVLSTIYNVNGRIIVKHKEKCGENWESLDIKQPKVINIHKQFLYEWSGQTTSDPLQP